MRVTIDTALKQITLHGSFSYSEFVAFHQALPEEWVGFTYTVDPYPYVWSSFPTVFDFTHTGTKTTMSDTQLPLFGDPVQD